MTNHIPMKWGVVICFALFVLWIVLMLAEMWFGMLGAEWMVKWSLTLAGVFVIVLVGILVFGSYRQEKRWRDDDYIA